MLHCYGFAALDLIELSTIGERVLVYRYQSEFAWCVLRNVVSIKLRSILWSLQSAEGGSTSVEYGLRKVREVVFA